MKTRTLRSLLHTGLAAGALALGACENKNDPTTPARPTTPPTGEVGPTPVPRTGATATGGATSGTGRTMDTAPAADNTERNKDHNVAPTAQDQGQARTDIDITAEIRKGVLALDNISTNAGNCKIITSGGVVTLRGPVANSAERDAIERIAKSVAGVTRVVNELEVKP